MTDLNKFNPYPDEATIRCPRCGQRATFRHAFSLVQRRDWTWWESRLWPSSRMGDWSGRNRWRSGQPPPTWKGEIIIEHDPELFEWRPPSDGHRRSDDGIVRCERCIGRIAHRLLWPEDAWYRFEVRRGLLWAWSRPHAVAMRDFIASHERKPGAHGYGFILFLSHIPGKFLQAKERDAIVATIDSGLRRL